MSTASDQNTASRSIYSDFVEYQNLDIADASDPVNGTIYAIDANVLLNLYKFTRKNAEEVIDALTKMSEVLFVPHQTLHEFWSRVEDVQKGDHHREAAGKIGSFSADIQRTVDTWLTRTGLKNASDSSAASDVEGILEKLENAASLLQTTITETQRESDKGNSGIVESLDKILAGRVGPAPSPEVRQRLREVFRKRVADGTPPGNRDVEIKNGQADKASGDFFIWQQCLDEARRRKDVDGRTYDLTLITNDLKDDWVRSARHGSRPLAHRALLREYAAHVGGVFRIATFANLVSTAEAHFGATVSDEAKAQVNEVDDPGVVGWTAESARKYLNALWNNPNYRGHLAVLLASYGVAKDEASPLSVDEAKQISNRDNMQGFSKPYKTILATETIAGVGGVEITLPMLSREFDEDLNDWAYKLQGVPLTPLGEAISRDPDYVKMLADVMQQIEVIRQERNA